MNKLLLYSLFLFFLGQAAEITKKEGILVSHELDSSQLIKSNEGFESLKNYDYFKVHDCDVNHVLHAMSHDNNLKNIEDYNQIQISQLSKVNLNGSHKRAVAGFWLSKFAVHAAAQTAYALVAGATSLIYPPAAPVVYCSLQLTFAAFVEIASTIVANKATVDTL